MYCPLDKRHPCPFPLPPTATYLGEDERGYYHMDGFFDGLGNMFKRMVKFTPKSFTPSNIYKGYINTTLTVGTFGAYQLLPKNIKKTVHDIAKIAVPVVAGGAAAYGMGPSIMGMLGPKLAGAGNLLGKALSSVGGSLFQKMTSLPPSAQSAIAQQVTPQDIAYAETHQGVYPPHIQALIDQKEREAYEYAVAQTQRTILSPTNQPTVNPALYGSSSLYPGLRQAQLEQQSIPPQDDSSAIGSTALIAGGAGILAVLLMRK
jgi:hypothetical protein